MYDQLNHQNDAQSDVEIGAGNDANADAKSMQNVVQNSVEKIDVKAVKLFDAAALKKIESAIKSAPLPPRKLTKTEALAELVPELQKQLQRGHTVASLALALGANGLLVGERKLAQLLRHQSSETLA